MLITIIKFYNSELLTLKVSNNFNIINKEDLKGTLNIGLELSVWKLDNCCYILNGRIKQYNLKDISIILLFLYWCCVKMILIER